ncbi:muramoyltetrapeptide carboxypeptidase [Klebsiella pneumoniae]|uniref:Muramoyltetrapeptide carboxypeptidase n=1 Tax=Klebsiella pneumoniae TaxID=573 RepID=A0A2X3EYG5_KLEPN|nr:muramoyltetrapeptide carboxypeptidase [Klebsiella pneumoniae]
MSQFYLVAPSGYCINQQAAARGVERLQQAGHEVAHQQVIPRRQQRFAGTEHERLADINQLAKLPGRNRIVLGRARRLRRQSPAAAYRLAGAGCPPAARPAADLRPQRFHRYPVGPAGHGQRHHLQRANARRQLRRGDPPTRLPSTISGRRYASRNSPSNGRAKGRTAGWKAPCGGEIWRC